MRYVTVESIAFCAASGHPVCLRLTYEVKPLRDGLESWFLVSSETTKNPSHSILA